MTKTKVAYAGYDWKEHPGNVMDDLRTKLKQFGLFVHEDPNCEGTDFYGYFITDQKLSSKQIKKLGNELIGDDNA